MRYAIAKDIADLTYRWSLRCRRCGGLTDVRRPAPKCSPLLCESATFRCNGRITGHNACLQRRSCLAELLLISANPNSQESSDRAFPIGSLGTFASLDGIGEGMRRDRLADTSPPGSFSELQRMAWFTKRRSVGQPKRSLFRELPGNAAQKSPDGYTLAKRRAHRVDLSAPVFVYGSIKGEPFSEISKTLDVCVKGALVAIKVRVVPEQRVLLTNLQTGQDLKCRVVRIDARRRAAALEFLEPCPGFWGIEFGSPSSAR